MLVFSLLVGMTVILYVYAHFDLFREHIAVDKIIPECFRGCRYGACSYYKEFYDPSTHKTLRPFPVDIKGKKLDLHYHVERDDFDNTQWNIKWQGRTLKTKGKVYTDESEVASFTKLPSSNDSRISKTVENKLPSITQKHEQKHTIKQEDLIDERF